MPCQAQASFGRLVLSRVGFGVGPRGTPSALGSQTLGELRARVVLRDGVLAVGDPTPIGNPSGSPHTAAGEAEWRQAFLNSRRRVAEAEEEVGFLRRFRDQTMVSGALLELEEAQRVLHELELEALAGGIPRAWWRPLERR